MPLETLEHPQEVPAEIIPALDVAKGYRRIAVPRERGGVVSMVVPDFGSIHPNAMQNIDRCMWASMHVTALDFYGRGPEYDFRPSSDLKPGTYRIPTADEFTQLRPDEWTKIVPTWWSHNGEREAVAVPFYQRDYTAGINSHPWAVNTLDDKPAAARKFLDHLHLYAAHGLQPAEGQPGQLSYFFSLQHRLSSRRTVIRTRAYLNKYWSEVFAAEEIEELAAHWEGQMQPRKLHIVTDPDDIEEAYTTRRFGSCMGYSRYHYDSSEHPSRVYGGKHSDLAVAVIYEPDAEEGDWSRIAARCIVWPDQMRASTSLYGDYARMEVSLKDAGYALSHNFDGAKLNRIECSRTGRLVMPYLDIAENASDRGSHIEIGPGELEVHTTNGLTGEEEYDYHCDCCGDGIHEGDARTVVIGWHSRYGAEHETWCEGCADHRTFYCDGSEHSWADNSAGIVSGPHGETYAEPWFTEQMGKGEAFICADDGYGYLSDDYVIADDDGDTYHVDSSAIRYHEGDGCYYTVDGYPEEDEDEEEEEAA